VRRLAGQFDPPQQLEVARARERLQHLFAGGLTLALDGLDDEAERGHVCARQRLGLPADVDQEHVVVAHCPKCPADPFELRPQLVRPRAVQDRTGDAQESAQPADRNPHLVQCLRIAPKPRTRVVREDLLVLAPDHHLQVRQGRLLAGRLRSTLALDDAEARVLGLALDVEALHDAPVLEYLDLVVHLAVLRSVLDGATRLQIGHFDELSLPQQPAKQVRDERRRLCGTAGLGERNLSRRLG
jgi:hypothetical protein